MEDLEDLKKTIIDLRLRGVRPADIARAVQRPISTVQHHLRYARDNHGVVYPPNRPEDAHTYIRRLRVNGILRGQGTMKDLLETLTCDQVDWLLRNAPKATTFVETVGVLIAQQVPDKEDD